MILQHSSFCGVLPPSQISSVFGQSSKQRNLTLHHELPLRRLTKTRPSTLRITSLGPGLFDGVAQVAANKVLIAAFGSGIIGQLAKPFASAFLYGKEFDIKSIFETGGFPSSHSCVTVASATLLGLERGFSDPIFGLTVVYAGLMMYDAQGVRRAVGVHAKILNKLLLQMQLNSIRSKDRDVLINSQPGRTSTLSNVEDLENSLLSQGLEASSQLRSAGLLVKSDNKTRGKTDREQLPSAGNFSADAEELFKLVPDGFVPLKESIGHTEFEVFGGALLGFLGGLAVHRFM